MLKWSTDSEQALNKDTKSPLGFRGIAINSAGNFKAFIWVGELKKNFYNGTYAHKKDAITANLKKYKELNRRPPKEYLSYLEGCK